MPSGFEIKQIKITNAYTGMEVTEIEEGQAIHVSVELDWTRNDGGIFATQQTLVITADANFDGTIDEHERHEYVVLGAPGDEFWTVWINLPDDGKSPGNGTPTDALKIDVDFADDSESKEVTVVNAPPRFVSEPTLGTSIDENGNSIATVFVRLADTGLLDSYAVTVAWGDGQTTTEADSFDEQDPNPDYGDYTKSVSLVRIISFGDELFPLTITIRDDDTGSRTYTINSMDVLRNDDDDNENDSSDLNDKGFNDVDIQKLDLGALMTPEMDAATGKFQLNYDPQVIRLWTSQSKDALVLPSTSQEYGEILSNAPTIAYTGQKELWLEGAGLVKTGISLSWQELPGPNTGICEVLHRIFGGSTVVTVWGIDLDVDSDNNNGFDYPENTAWEEYLENNEYAIGKMLTREDSHFTPARLRLPAGLDPNDPTIAVKISSTFLRSGQINFWTTFKADPNRNSATVGEGGNLLANVAGSYSLSELRYDAATGGITVWLEAVAANDSHDTKLEVDTYGKPDDRLKATISGLEIGEIEDEVKWMVVHPGSFYPFLNANQNSRNAFAAELVYGEEGGGIYAHPIDDPAFTLKLIEGEELEELLDTSDTLQPLDRKYISDIFNYRLSAPGDPTQSVPGLGVGLYLDHVSGKYILAIRGTDFADMKDWIANLSQLVAKYSAEYKAAIWVTHLLATEIPVLRTMDVAGHSLGGGLAAAAAIASGLHADTFNAAGLQKLTLADPVIEVNGIPVEYVTDSFIRYDAAEQYVDSYEVWHNYTRQDGTSDAPDVLSYFQNNLALTLGSQHFLPDAVGRFVNIEGLLDLTAGETEFIADLREFLKAPVDVLKVALVDVLVGLVTIDLSPLILLDLFPFNPLTAYDALMKIKESHSMPSVHYGLMHGPGWNVYDVPTNEGSGGPL